MYCGCACMLICTCTTPTGILMSLSLVVCYCGEVCVGVCMEVFPLMSAVVGIIR